MLTVTNNEVSGSVESVKLFGVELLDQSQPCESELWVNGLPLKMRPHTDPNQSAGGHLKGERFTDHFSGWGLVLARRTGGRAGLKHSCFGIQTTVRRELCDMTLPCPGPGGPVVEAPLFVDTFSVLNWNWQFWGEDTRMIFPTAHSSGPEDEFGHVGYEHDTPENCKRFLQNAWRRTYPGVMVIHGGLFYNAKTEHWIALTCRQAHSGYVLNIDNAGRGVSYDFTLHDQFPLGESLNLPEVKLYYGENRTQMMSWLADYVTYYYEPAPGWVSKTVFGHGVAWDTAPTWTEQGDQWSAAIESGVCSAMSYSLVTNRPVQSGTDVIGYEPDPNHGTIDEFRRMCRRLADKGVPILIWMSHSGLMYRGGMDIDDDWFIRGIDGRVCCSWGNIDNPGLAAANPGHPGYIEYTKKWIRFYIKECGAKGIFFDCLGWVFPPDYRPRPWMRYPGDTNVMAIKFMREVYACIKECDPDAIMLGEGTSLEGPVNVFSVVSNPKRAIDGLGPRDFLLMLNQYSTKRMAISMGPRLAPASGYCMAAAGEKWSEHNRLMTKILAERGGNAFTALPGDLSIVDDILVVPGFDEDEAAGAFTLPEPWRHVRSLREMVTNTQLSAGSDGVFQNVPAGIYAMFGK